MCYRKYFLASCLVLAFVISGCGRKPDKEKVLDRALKIPIEQKRELITLPTRKSAKMAGPQRGVTLAAGEILVSDFESWPNNLGGVIGVYGALEPDWEQVNLYPVSWIYDPTTLAYDPSNVHSGQNSFRLVNGLGIKPGLTWGSFSMDLGPTIDLTTVPKKVDSLDVSGYKYLTLWAKGEKGGEKMELLIRDAHALNYKPQVQYKLPKVTTDWQKITVPLEDIMGKVDLSQVDNIGIAFGKDIGNAKGDIAYIDDFVFTNNP